jgi:Carboxypeptidase regulatory-like domain
MVSARPAALILALAGGLMPCVQQATGHGAAWAQPVSTARLVPSPMASPATAQPAQPSQIARPGSLGVAGRVLSNTTPLAAVEVYAYQLASFSLRRVETDGQGNFLFRDLPAGLYKIIAHKQGFAPVVILLTRTAAQAYQYLDLQLPQRQGGAVSTAAPANPAGTADNFWALRSSLPPDVLRDVEVAALAGPIGPIAVPDAGAGSAAAAGDGPVPEAPQSGDGGTKAARAPLPGEGGYGPGDGRSIQAGESLAGRFRTEIQAMTGVADIAQVGAGQVSTGKVGIQGQLGDVKVGLSGRFWLLNSDGSAAGGLRGMPEASDGQTSNVSLNLQAGAGSRITLDSVSDRLVPRSGLGYGDPVGLDHYQVSWSQALGESSHSDFAAQYTAANNYNRLAVFEPASIPDASRTWRVEGAYSTNLGDDSSLQTGFRYSDLQAEFSTPVISPGGGISTFTNPSAQSTSTLSGLTGGNGVAAMPLVPDYQTVDLFSRGTMRLQSAFTVEYGLYTMLQDGSLSLTPQGGMVLQLGDGWQVKGSASQRVYQETAVAPEYLPVLYKATDLCEDGGKACYEIDLTSHAGEDNSISFSALERIVGQTLQLYFSDVVFDRFENLYLVPGDRLPELRLMMTYRLSPHVRTQLETSVASGGGGTFFGADGRAYRNQVSYVVTSLDTHVLNTATGVFLAFRHVTQDLSTPGGASTSGVLGPGATTVGFDRVQLMISQDMNFLWKLAAEWALQVNMELERDNAPYLASTDSGQIHRRILGGIAVKF